MKEQYGRNNKLKQYMPRHTYIYIRSRRRTSAHDEASRIDAFS